jgi:hypothetical protein
MKFKETKMKIEVKTITPAMAEKYLAANQANRRVRPGVVAQYARDMKAGAWKLNGEAIRFNGAGLMDGQHRCLACVEADTAFRSVVISGLESDAKVTLDTGAKRTFTDVLRWRGESNAAKLSSVVSWSWRYEHNALRDFWTRPSHNELSAWLDENPGVRDAVGVGEMVRRQVPLSATIVGGVYYKASTIDAEDAAAFFERLRSGADLEEGSPILALRRWAERTAAKPGRPAPVVFSAVTIKALNAWRAGKSMAHVVWRAGGAQAEAFPVIGEDA